MAARPHPRSMPDPMKETPTGVPMAWIDGSKEAAATLTVCWLIWSSEAMVLRARPSEQPPRDGLLAGRQPV
jgi:hypothetical protein